jgi:nitroimidazol reductase NimA-like FMN-containing flavoprotein (pyridoxamine 5'-phosphate oxidase superfamily)
LRRQEQEITDRAELDAILERATVCRLGLIDGDRPYIVPVCFGYSDNALYVHSAPGGYKLDILGHQPQVCFEVEVDVQMVPAAKPCAWSVHYASIIGWGQATLVDDEEEKRAALSVLMAHYGDKGPCAFSDVAIAKMAVIKITIERMTGKRSHR